MNGPGCEVCDEPTRKGHSLCAACEDLFDDDQHETGKERDD